MRKGEKDSIFSEKDLFFLRDTDFLKTKKVITHKVEGLLLDTQKHLRPFVKTTSSELAENLLVRSGKISRGENYLDLPYQVLDYPRLFSKESIFTYRSMFWWGNFFSCTLHIQGAILNKFRNTLASSLSGADLPDSFFCINSSPWDYHYQPSNYIKLANIADEDLKRHIRDRDFVKISRKLPLEQHNLL